MPIRRRIVEASIGGLSSDVVRKPTLDAMRSWFPKPMLWKANIYRASARWKHRASAIQMLLRGLSDDDSRDRHVAAEVLAMCAHADEGVAIQLQRALTIVDAEAAAAVLDALARGWTDAVPVSALLATALKSRHDEIRLVAACRRVDLGQHGLDDRDALLQLARTDSLFDLTYYHGSSIAQALATGWPEDVDVRERCLEALSTPRQQPAAHRRSSTAPLAAGSTSCSRLRRDLPI